MNSIKDNILQSFRTPAPFTYDLAKGGAVVIAVMGLFLLWSGMKKKSDYTKITGTIVRLDERYDRWPARNFGDYRYLQIDRLPYVFKTYVGGSDTASMSNREKIDQLQAGDTITVYFENGNEDEIINFKLYYLDKNGKPYYSRKNYDGWGALLCLVTAVLLFLGAIFLQKKGIIQKGVM